ncbi:hypothetical protein [Streptomyces sp. NBC_01423]|uniref:hypothetical protein n=1 Tax=Streptomyces sp. NBC_01423 TaxID=2903860 RepID=UPI002E27BA00|nr:hypothetical protein [Streptomyces sp. NBC_01423]
MSSPSQKPSLPRRSPKIQEALAARDDLAAALTTAGIQLPAMDVRTPWPDAEGDGRARPADYALVNLGICSAPVAHALAEVIRNGTTR